MEFRISKEAGEDIELARLFYEAQRHGLGDRLHHEVRVAMDYIEASPKGFQVRYQYYRFAPIGVFPYIIIYSLEGEFIVIHRVRHTSQRPLRRFFGE